MKVKEKIFAKANAKGKAKDLVSLLNRIMRHYRNIGYRTVR